LRSKCAKNTSYRELAFACITKEIKATGVLPVQWLSALRADFGNDFGKDE
jgi:hypothetical protein